MKKLLILAFCLAPCALLPGCATPPVPIPANAGKLANDCLPEAIEMVKGLQDAGIKSEIVRMGFQHTGMITPAASQSIVTDGATYFNAVFSTYGGEFSWIPAAVCTVTAVADLAQ